ncbi:hypothetical protein HDU67_005810 [Dinochytrium kinnereticum]|nr:hypothetical protein HDU67_005810 [Dinochytrium kinnereticum]
MDGQPQGEMMALLEGPDPEQMAATEGSSASKRKRQTQSCDRCREKKRRCDALRPTCTNCLKAKAICTMLVEPKKRGPKRGEKQGDDKDQEVRVMKRRRIEDETPKQSFDKDSLFLNENEESFKDTPSVPYYHTEVSILREGDFGSKDASLGSFFEKDSDGTRYTFSPGSSGASPNSLEFSGDSDISQGSRQGWEVASRSASIRSDAGSSPQVVWDFKPYADNFNFDISQMASQMMSDPSTSFFLANGRVGVGAQSVMKSPSLRYPSPIQLSPDLYDKVLSFSGQSEEALPWSSVKLVDALPPEDSSVLGGLLIADLPDTPGEFYLHLIQKYADFSGTYD